MWLSRRLLIRLYCIYRYVIPKPLTAIEKYFIQEDLSLGSIGEGFAETFLPKQKGLGRLIRKNIEESGISQSVVVNSDKMNPSQKEGDGSRAKKNRNSQNFQSKESQWGKKYAAVAINALVKRERINGKSSSA